MNIVVVLILLLVGLWTTSMASKGSQGHRGQDRRTSSCRNFRMFNRRLQVCLKDARTNIRMLEEEKNENMGTIKELEIKKQTCMINNDILEDEIKSLKEQMKCKFWSQCYKTFIMLNSAETEIYPAHKCENDNNS